MCVCFFFLMISVSLHEMLCNDQKLRAKLEKAFWFSKQGEKLKVKARFLEL